MGASWGGGSPVGNNALKGQVDATLAANLPSDPAVGDRYSISVAGSFENDALILPASYAFTVGDRIEWDGTNWLASDLGDDLVAHEASNTEHGISAFGSTLVDDVDAATARTTLGIPSIQGYVWSVANGATNAVSRNGYLLDSSGGIFTVTLPASPSVGDTIAFTDIGSAGTNNITIGRNGTNIDGAAEDLIVDTNKSYFKLTYADATIGWALSDVGQVAA